MLYGLIGEKLGHSYSKKIHESFDERLERLRKETETEKNKKTRKDSPTQINKQITLPNKGRLANILQDNVRINRKLDDDEVQRADIELKKIDNSGRNVIRNIYNLI